MIAFLSPAKSLDFETPKQVGDLTIPRFVEESVKINKSLKRLSRKKLMELQGISRQLAELNYNRNQIWELDHTKDIKQAVFAFKGDVYIGLEAEKWSAKEMEIANGKLRILSGLYGILKPSDGIRPYRLEMGTSLKVGRRRNLYEFWKDKLPSLLKENLGLDEFIINLASQEYFKAIQVLKPKNPIINVDFKDWNKGQYKTIGFLAKKARGMMANYLVKNNINTPETLKRFDVSGYYFDDKLSNETEYVFLRDEQK